MSTTVECSTFDERSDSWRAISNRTLCPVDSPDRARANRPLPSLDNQDNHHEMDPAFRRSRRHRRSPSRRPLLEGLEQRLLLSTNVLTYHNDIASTGLNASETQLTPGQRQGRLVRQAVRHRRWTARSTPSPWSIPASRSPAGPNTIAGAAGLHDVVFVATEHDTLYAIDASHPAAAPSSGSGASSTSQHGYSAPPARTSTTRSAPPRSPRCPAATSALGDISPEIGITGTPVIDPTTEHALRRRQDQGDRSAATPTTSSGCTPSTSPTAPTESSRT